MITPSQSTHDYLGSITSIIPCVSPTPPSWRHCSRIPHYHSSRCRRLPHSRPFRRRSPRRSIDDDRSRRRRRRRRQAGEDPREDNRRPSSSRAALSTMRGGGANAGGRRRAAHRARRPSSTIRIAWTATPGEAAAARPRGGGISRRGRWGWQPRSFTPAR